MKRSRLLVITLLASSLMLSACDLSFIDDNTSQVTASLSKIAVSKTPDKVVYEINEQLDTTGLEVTATYSDNSTKNVTQNVVFSTVDMSTAGKKDVSISYSEGGSSVFASFQITVNAAKEYCSITFDANGGSGSMEPLKVEKGQSFTLPGCTFTAPENKTFKAWQIGYSEFAVGTSVLANNDMTLKAVWADSGVAPTQTYVVSFDANGGTGTMTAQTVNAGSKYTLPACTFTGPNNYTFKAWQVGNDTTERAVGYQITVNSNVVVKALWKDSVAPITEYTVTYKVNGGTGSDYVVSHIQSGASHQLVSFATAGFTAPTNKQFKNWKIGTSYYEVGAFITVTSNVTVNANYETIKRTITFDANGGSGTMTAQSVNSGSTYTLPSCTFTAPTDKTFKAWQIGSDTTERAVGYQFTVNSDVTIKALWKEKSALDSWTIMLYISGNDLESGNDGYGNYNTNKAGYATKDITEILSVNGQPDDVNIIIETGGAGKWKSTYGISNTKLGRYYVENKQLKQDPTNSSLGDASMGATSTFQSFLEWGLTNYPAEKVGVILWNHGGALNGVCYDEKHGDDSLTNDEVVSALSGAFTKLGRTEKLEFIGYDACLMQVQDIAEFNSPYFNYMVGSQESEAGEGWDYDSWVDDLYNKKSTTTILSAICDGFINAYNTNYPSYANDQTLSVLDLSKISAFMTAVESLASDLKSLISSNNNTFTNILSNTKNYADSWMYEEDYETYMQYGYPPEWFSSEVEDGETYYFLPGYYIYGSYDAKDLFTNIKNTSKFSSVSAKCQAAIDALSQLVIKNAKGNEAGNSNGLSVICKYSSDSIVKYYNSYTHFTNWKSAAYSRF